jgi:hypothetical protein
LSSSPAKVSSPPRIPSRSRGSITWCTMPSNRLK